MPKKKQRRAANKQTKSQTKKRKKQLVKAGVSLKFGHESIKNNWNSKQTLRQNYKRLGLAFSVDEAIKSAKLKEEKVGVLTKELTEIQAAPKKEKYIPKSMPIDEQRRLIALMKKYGDNYKRMARDIKINVYQKTENELKHRINLFKHLQGLDEDNKS